MSGRRPGAVGPHPHHPWVGRVAAARGMIMGALGTGPVADSVLAGVARIDRALHDASDDLDRLEGGLSQLDERAATAELKMALRSRPDPTAPDTPLIASLRQRRHSFHGLQNRRRELLEDVERALTDLDTLAARCFDEAHGRRDERRGGRTGLDDEVRRLDDDLAALAEAHRELEALDGGTGSAAP